MGKNAFALGADFLCPDRMGYLGAEHLDFAAVGLPQQGGDLLGEVGAVVHHRQQYAVDLELGVDLPLHLVYGLEQLFQALGGQVLRLNGDYDPVGGGQGVDREHTQGWLAVNQDNETMMTEDRTLSHAQAIKMRKFSQDGRLNMDVLRSRRYTSNMTSLATFPWTN